MMKVEPPDTWQQSGAE